MQETSIRCFVCDEPILSNDIYYHPKVNLPVCNSCRGTEKEASKIEELFEGLAEGFVCGCI